MSTQGDGQVCAILATEMVERAYRESPSPNAANKTKTSDADQWHPSQSANLAEAQASRGGDFVRQAGDDAADSVVSSEMWTAEAGLQLFLARQFPRSLHLHSITPPVETRQNSLLKTIPRPDSVSVSFGLQLMELTERFSFLGTLSGC